MRKGIDVSENNGTVDWQAVKDAGIEFVIIRLGYGNRHLDEAFYLNFNGAVKAGLDVGVYYYSYALTKDAAEDEAEFLIETLKDGGIMPEDLALGIWLDMEDADGYKRTHNMPSDQVITDICGVFVTSCRDAGYGCGIYASYSWLDEIIDLEQLRDVPIWCAQWEEYCDMEEAYLWQFTDALEIGGRYFDGNYEMGGDYE